eukprot:7381526-Prymnesium_polylepis.2
MELPSMHPQHAIDALFALYEEPSSQESGNGTEPECTSPPRMTKDIQDTKLTPTKFTLSGVKRKTSDDLELIYENSSPRRFMYRSRRANRSLYSIAVATLWPRLPWKNTYV